MFTRKGLDRCVKVRDVQCRLYVYDLLAVT